MNMANAKKATSDRRQDYHSFERAVARQLGMPAAVVFQNLVFWIGENKKHGRNYHDGRYWTYNSLREYAEKFDYLTEKQIRTALEKLVAAGLIIKGRHHHDRFNRRNWYALGDPICPTGHIAQPKVAIDGIAQEGSQSAPEGECIENKYKPDSKPYLLCDTEADLEVVWHAYPADRRRDRDGCLRLIAEARKEISLNDLVAATKAYEAESAEFSRSLVCFSDNWLRERRWQRHLNDLRQHEEDTKVKAIRLPEKLPEWIRSRNGMCKHLTEAQVLLAIEQGKISKGEAQAAGLLL